MPKRIAKKAAPTAAKSRPGWKGNLTFGLVSFAAEAFNALNREESDIHFHQLHAKCHRRIHYQKVCPIHGEIPNDQVVSGYERSKGEYIEIHPDELDALRTAQERALTIDAFVSPDHIDPLYYDGRMYYVVPAGPSSEAPYQVMVAAMDHENVYGIGKVVFSGKEQIALLRVVEGVLHMALLNYQAEILPPADIAATLTKPASQSRQVKLAQTLIREWSGDDFDFSKYTDTYRKKVQELIKAKSKGTKVPVSKPEEDEPVTINLMEALTKSLQHPRPSHGKKKAKAAKRRA